MAVSTDGYVPGFSWDVFISYAHLADQRGWVTRFAKELEGRLSSVLDRKARVWFDADWINGGAEIRERIEAGLRASAVLVPVISPAYVRSTFCSDDELGSFLPERRSRIVPISKLPLEEGTYSPLPKDMKCLRCFQETETGCDQFDAGDARFQQVVREASQTILQILRQMRKSRQRIYISQPAPSIDDALLNRRRTNLVDELHGQGYRVLPEQVITRFTTDDQIRSWQEQCDVVVLLLHDKPDGITHKQVGVARELGKPCIVAITDLDKVAPTIATGEPAVLLTSPRWREDIVELVKKKLLPRMETAAPAPGRRAVYLLCSPEDYDQSCELRKLILADLEDPTLQVLLPDFSLGHPFKFQRDHEEKLRNCEGVILYWGVAEKNWFDSQDQEVLPRAISWTRKRKYAAEAKYLSAPASEEKQHVQAKRGELVIRQFDRPDVGELRPFLTSIPVAARTLQAGGES